MFAGTSLNREAAVAEIHGVVHVVRVGTVLSRDAAAHYVTRFANKATADALETHRMKNFMQRWFSPARPGFVVSWIEALDGAASNDVWRRSHAAVQDLVAALVSQATNRAMPEEDARRLVHVARVLLTTADSVPATQGTATLLRDGFASLTTVVAAAVRYDDECRVSEPVAEAALLRLHMLDKQRYLKVLLEAVRVLIRAKDAATQGLLMEPLLAVGVMKELMPWNTAAAVQGPPHGWVRLTKEHTPVAWHLLVEEPKDGTGAHEVVPRLQDNLKPGECVVVRVKGLWNCPRAVVKETDSYGVAGFLEDEDSAAFMLPKPPAGPDVVWTYQLAVLGADQQLHSRVNVPVLAQCKRTVKTASGDAWHTTAPEGLYLDNRRTATAKCGSPRSTTRSSGFVPPGRTKVHDGYAAKQQRVVRMLGRGKPVSVLSLFFTHPRPAPAFVPFPQHFGGVRERAVLSTNQLSILWGGEAAALFTTAIFNGCNCTSDCTGRCGCRRDNRRCSSGSPAVAGCACKGQCGNAMAR